VAESLLDSWREMAQRPATDRNAHPFPCPPYLRPSRFPLPNANGVVPQSPGLRRPRRYPGSVSENRNNRNAVVPRQRTAGLLCTGWVVVIQTNRSVARSAASSHVPRTSPVWCDGATPSGLLIYWPFPQGSASVAQPWALWQNPVGIPGGEYPTPSEHTPSSSGFPKGYCQRFPHLCSSAPICG
jgi:hypothetical protein